MKKLTAVVLLCALMPRISVSAEQQPEIITDNLHIVTEEHGGYVTEKYYYDDGTEYIPQYSSEAELQEVLPAYYRNTNISPPKNQLISGPCWAFSFLGAMEAGLIKKGQADIGIDFSEAHMSYFGKNACDSKNGDGVNIGLPAYSKGGNFHNAALMVANGTGPAYESDAPFQNYVSESGGIQAVPESKRYICNAGIDELQEYDEYEIDAVKSAIYNEGAALALYYCDTNTMFRNDTYSSYFCPFSTKEDFYHTNHAIMIVGWDDNFPAENMVVPYREIVVNGGVAQYGEEKYIMPKSNGAWIVKQSWGNRFGDNGYEYISYNNPMLKYSLKVNNDTYDGIYSHTGDIGLYVSSKNLVSANIFTANEDCVLKAVSLETGESGSVDMWIYKGCRNYPDDGRLALEMTNEKVTNAYTKINLPKEVSLKKGEKFSVIVKGARIRYEGSNTYAQQLNRHYSSEPGESMYITMNIDYDGTNSERKGLSTWVDGYSGECEYMSKYIGNFDPSKYQYNNVSIRAYTQSTPNATLSPTEKPTTAPTGTPVPTTKPTSTPSPTVEPTSRPLIQLNSFVSSVEYYSPEKVKCKLHCANLNKFDVNGTAYTAIYTTDGRLVSLTSSDFSIAASGELNIPIIASCQKGLYTKIFLWDGSAPLSNTSMVLLGN